MILTLLISSCWEVVCKKVNKFTWNQLCWDLFSTRFTGCGKANLLKETPVLVFSSKYSEQLSYSIPGKDYLRLLFTGTFRNHGKFWAAINWRSSSIMFQIKIINKEILFEKFIYSNTTVLLLKLSSFLGAICHMSGINNLWAETL